MFRRNLQCRNRAKPRSAEYLLPAFLVMRIQLTTDDSIRLTADDPGLSFEPGDTMAVSPFHLLAASLASCTYSVLHSYGGQAGIPLDSLAIEVSWDLAGDPFRVTSMDMILDWPALPPSRREAARRAAARCTIHNTLEHGSPVTTEIKRTGDEDPAPAL